MEDGLILKILIRGKKNFLETKKFFKILTRGLKIFFENYNL